MIYFLLAFVILTNPHLQPDYTSLSRVELSRKDCTHFPEGGVGCSRAILTFSRVHLSKREEPEWVNVVFHNPEGGGWSGTFRFRPRDLHPLPDGRFEVKGISWRLPE